jgi:DNA-directed RNA polymerase specialized sigma24 family protein
MDDNEIVAAIAAGDPAGLAAAYDKYAAGVYGYCHWMLREPAPAADALVETFVAAAPELGGLEDAIAARALLYATARNECHRQLSADSSAAQAGFRNPEHEAGELSIRHGLSEAELAAVLEVPWQQAHELAAHARDHLVAPSIALLDRIPAPLQEQVLRRAVVSAPAGCGDRTVIQTESGDTAVTQTETADTPATLTESVDTPATPDLSAAPATGPSSGKLRAWRTVRAHPGAAIGIAAIVSWVTAAVSAVVITVTGLHAALPLATRAHAGKTVATSPVLGRHVSLRRTASPSPSAGPSSRPSAGTTNRSAALTTVRPSPTQPGEPSPSPSATPSPSASPSASPSPSATPTSSPTSTSP